MRRTLPRASRLLLLLSFLVAASAALLLQGHLARLEASAAAAGPGRPTVVATTDLARGATIPAAALEVVPVPDRYRPPGSFEDPAAVAGRLLSAPVVAGEAVVGARLAPPGGPVASLVPEGLRAVPVIAPIPDGMIAPGDRVDVLATFASGQPHTETVATDVEVLTTLPTGPDAGAATLMLLVSPEDGERLAYATAFAQLSIAVAPATSAVG